MFDFNLTIESRPGAFDTITDFSHGSDMIDLSGIDANTLIAGDQALSFIGGAAFSHVAGQLRMVNVAALGLTRILGDVNGNGTIDFEARVSWTGGISPGLTGLDFTF